MIRQLFPVGIPGAYRTAGFSNKATAGWKLTAGSADTDTLADLATLRRQSRDLIRNEALPSGAIGTMVSGVVGNGVIPQARIDYEYLGITEEEAEKWENAAERIFRHVAEKPTFDSACKLNFYQMQRLIYRSKKESGDALAMRRFIERPGKALATSVQIIEADRLATPLDMQINPMMRAGLELDEHGDTAHYWIMQRHPAEMLAGTSQFTAAAIQTNLSEYFTRIPAYDLNGQPLVLMLVDYLRPGQSRGVPALAPVIELFKQLARYSEAEVTAAVIAGMFAVFVKSPQAGGPAGPLPPGLLPGQVGLQNNAIPDGNKAIKMQSGMVVDLLPGEEIEVADATRPNSTFEPFVTAVLSQIGTSLGLPREVMLKQYNTSYSAARAAIMDAYRQFLIERGDLITQFCQPVWSWVISEAVARGLLKAPGFFDDPIARDAWLGTEWIGAPAPQIDPVKEAAAATAWVELGIKSKQDVCAEQGKDWYSTFKQRAKERRMEDAAGIAVPAAVQAQLQQQQEQREQQQAAPGAKPVQKKPSKKEEATLEQIFTALASRGLPRMRAEVSVEMHPKADRIKYVNSNFDQIIAQLKAAGTVTVTEETANAGA